MTKILRSRVDQRSLGSVADPLLSKLDYSFSVLSMNELLVGRYRLAKSVTELKLT
jgi:hypothetical protein